MEKPPCFSRQNSPAQETEEEATGTQEATRNRGAKSHGKVPNSEKQQSTVEAKANFLGIPKAILESQATT
ncbi:hypothetical protein MA16_Dca027152 [Dendrobium catenatum]|uniref:Uncharacterized protein n=1 Tax=Dendrobium catenatum TaxID=906689 RepID=A0A2I0VI89_9ASPA|nr:hypothetical protein MA16_Dca027152 [Dendrobium catenatum]